MAPPDAVFVFGSNLAGIHGAGAAKFAARWRGAQDGVGEGRTGGAYAIPTKDARLRTLSIADSVAGVGRFLAYAAGHPETAFEVTRVGCGLAGYADADVAPLFFMAPPNCVLPYTGSGYAIRALLHASSSRAREPLLTRLRLSAPSRNGHSGSGASRSCLAVRAAPTPSERRTAGSTVYRLM